MIVNESQKTLHGNEVSDNMKLAADDLVLYRLYVRMKKKERKFIPSQYLGAICNLLETKLCFIFMQNVVINLQ